MRQRRLLFAGALARQRDGRLPNRLAVGKLVGGGPGPRPLGTTLLAKTVRGRFKSVRSHEWFDALRQPSDVWNRYGPVPNVSEGEEWGVVEQWCGEKSSEFYGHLAQGGGRGKQKGAGKWTMRESSDTTARTKEEEG